MQHQIQCCEREEIHEIHREDPENPSPVELPGVYFERFVFTVDQDICDQVSRLNKEHLYPDPREPQHRRVEVTEEHQMITDNKENSEATDTV